MNPEITKLLPTHWDQARRIYQQGLDTGQASFETTAPAWEQWDAGHLPLARLILMLDREPRGWAALSPVSNRTVYAGVAEVSVYVGTEWRGRGFGRVLLERLIAESVENGIWTLQASIFPENIASLALHRSLGFREVGRREKIARRDDVWRDTILLERRSAKY